MASPPVGARQRVASPAPGTVLVGQFLDEVVMKSPVFRVVSPGRAPLALNVKPAAAMGPAPMVSVVRAPSVNVLKRDASRVFTASSYTSPGAREARFPASAPELPGAG